MPDYSITPTCFRFIPFASWVQFRFGIVFGLVAVAVVVTVVGCKQHLTSYNLTTPSPRSSCCCWCFVLFFCCTAFIFRFLPGFRFVAAAANRPQKNIKSENLISNNSGEFIVRLPCFPPESICICGFVSVSVAAHPWISPGCIHTDWLGVFSGCEFRIFSIFRSLAWLMGALHLANTFICRA